MAFNFPTNPTVGQLYSQSAAGVYFEYQAGGYWKEKYYSSYDSSSWSYTSSLNTLTASISLTDTQTSSYSQFAERTLTTTRSIQTQYSTQSQFATQSLYATSAISTSINSNSASYAQTSSFAILSGLYAGTASYSLTGSNILTASYAQKRGKWITTVVDNTQGGAGNWSGSYTAKSNGIILATMYVTGFRGNTAQTTYGLSTDNTGRFATNTFFVWLTSWHWPLPPVIGTFSCTKGQFYRFAPDLMGYFTTDSNDYCTIIVEEWANS